MGLRYTYTTVDLNKHRQVKDAVYRVPRVARYESNFNINYETRDSLYEKLTSLVSETPNDQELGSRVRNLIKNNRYD